MVASQPLKKAHMSRVSDQSESTNTTRAIITCYWIVCLPSWYHSLTSGCYTQAILVHFKCRSINSKSLLSHTWRCAIAHGDIYKLYIGCHNINLRSSAQVRWHFEELSNSLSKSNNRLIIKVIWGQFQMFHHCQINRSCEKNVKKNSHLFKCFVQK